MGQRMGRPPKATTAEKIAIVDQYYITNSDGDAFMLRAHGIYKKLSTYAKLKGYALEPHDFSRDTAVREYIDSLINTSIQKEKHLIGIPTHEPLDVVALMMTGKTNVERVLKDREKYFENLHIRAAKAIEQYAVVSRQCAQYREAAAEANARSDMLQQKVETLSLQLRDARRDAAYLKRIIRKDVEPERAQQFFASLTSREDVADIVEASVMHSINVLTHNDRQMQADAQTEADALNLDNLFK